MPPELFYERWYSFAPLRRGSLSLSLFLEEVVESEEGTSISLLSSLFLTFGHT